MKTIKAIKHDGETYLNARDICLAMETQKLHSLSVMRFIRRFIADIASVDRLGNSMERKNDKA